MSECEDYEGPSFCGTIPSVGPLQILSQTDSKAMCSLHSFPVDANEKECYLSVS